MHKKLALFTALALASILGAFAISTERTHADDKTDCALTYTRTACAGQEAESFKKCDGKKTCTKYVPADSAEKCSEAAVAACSNDRLNITQSKVINATWKGKPLKNKGGKDDMCLDYGKRDTEFNQCTKK